MAIKEIVLEDINTEGAALILRVDNEGSVLIGAEIPATVRDPETGEEWEQNVLGNVEVRTKDLISSIDLLQAAHAAESHQLEVEPPDGWKTPEVDEPADPGPFFRDPYMP